MTQVFISYKSEYREFAERLRDQLRAWGFGTWFDHDDIPEGAYFRHEIQKGLESSQVVVGVLTAEALQSREVMWEWDYALSNSRLIPLKYRECALPYHLAGTQYVDFVRGEAAGFTQLQQSLAHPAKEGRASPRTDAQPARRTRTEETNRSRMLQKVYDFWVVGVLDNALRESGAFELGLDSAPGAVLKHRNYGDYKLPTSAKIRDVFKDLNRELLILGAPGAGKTILMLQLARSLIIGAQEDETQPIPVVFNLSSWTAERKPLAEWLVDGLRLNYQVPRKVAKEWVEREQLLLLLDGLDEVHAHYRDGCVETINEFRRHYRSVDMAVCSRIADYQLLTSKLDLQGAITLQPLTREQLESYLAREELSGLRDVMQTDDMLHELAGTPFLLNTMTYAYRGLSASSLRSYLKTLTPPARREEGMKNSWSEHFKRRLNVEESDGEGAAQRQHLFEAYVERQLKTPPPTLPAAQEQYRPRQTRHYLAWLARKMTEQGQTVFHIEGLRPTWLESQKQQLQYTIGVWLAFGLPFALLFGLVLGLAAGLSPAPRMALIREDGSSVEIGVGLAESLSRLALGVAFGFGAGLVIVLTGGLAIMLSGRSVRVGLGVGITGRSDTDEDNIIRTRPNQGIRRSSWNALRAGLLAGLIAVIVLALAQSWSGPGLVLAGGLFFGLVAGLGSGGGRIIMQHLTLRLLLYRSGHIPLNYARFLDYAASIGLLRKVGGGYIFVHRYLLEYFAELEA